MAGDDGVDEDFELLLALAGEAEDDNEARGPDNGHISASDGEEEGQEGEEDLLASLAEEADTVQKDKSNIAAPSKPAAGNDFPSYQYSKLYQYSKNSLCINIVRPYHHRHYSKDLISIQ